MLKKVLILLVLSIFVFQGAAFAGTGSIILEDTLYGAIIGGLLGGAWYLLDDDEFGQKVGTGIGVGVIGGFILGVTDVTSVVEIEKNDVKIAMPTISIEEREGELMYTASLVNLKF